MKKVRFNKSIIMMILFLAWPLASLSNAEDGNKWMIEFNLGIAALHDNSFNHTYFSIYGSRSLKPDNSVSLDFGFFRGYHEILYGGWLIGIKYRFFSEKKFSPFIFGGAGGIVEEDRGSTYILAAAAGVDLNLTPKMVIPIAYQFGMHRSSMKGPHVISIGIGYRF